MEKKLPNIEITELFLIKADWNRTFMGQIIRETTDNKTIVRGNVIINEGKCWSVANTQEELAKNLDGICTMKLDKGLHDDAGKFTEINGEKFFLS